MLLKLKNIKRKITSIMRVGIDKSLVEKNLKSS